MMDILFMFGLFVTGYAVVYFVGLWVEKKTK